MGGCALQSKPKMYNTFYPKKKFSDPIKTFSFHFNFAWAYAKLGVIWKRKEILVCANGAIVAFFSIPWDLI